MKLDNPLEGLADLRGRHNWPLQLRFEHQERVEIEKKLSIQDVHASQNGQYPKAPIRYDEII